MAMFEESAANSFDPTVCPSLPSFTPYSAFQRHLTSTLSSFLRIALRSALDHLSKYPCRPLRLMSQAVSATRFTAVNHHSFAEFQPLGIPRSFRGV